MLYIRKLCLNIVMETTALTIPVHEHPARVLKEVQTNMTEDLGRFIIYQ